MSDGYMMDNIPPKVKLGGMVYQVQLTNQNNENFDSEHYFGMLNTRDGILWLSSRLKPEALRITFFHELFHAIVNLMNLYVPAQIKNPEEYEEYLVEAFAQGFCTFLSENDLFLQSAFFTIGHDENEEDSELWS